MTTRRNRNGRLWRSGSMAVAWYLSGTALVAQASQNASNVIPEVSDLVVHIQAVKSSPPPQRTEDGAGIVIGNDATNVYIATAKHAVTQVRNTVGAQGESVPWADTLKVEFSRGTGAFIPAVGDRVTEDDTDLALIRVGTEEARAAGFTPISNRLGDLGSISVGSGVRAVAAATSFDLLAVGGVNEESGGDIDSLSPWACGVAKSGAGYCWGDNTYGQLGIEDVGEAPVPEATVPTRIALDKSFVQISTVLEGHNGQGNGELSAFSLGIATCGITYPDGALYCWGTAEDCSLGDSNGVTGSRAPVRVAEPE